jgi:glycosyltransferase involved in cell wall biosynthesis
VPELKKIAVVIPAFKVANQILRVIERIGPEVSLIIVIDDKCPESSGELVRSSCKDKRVVLITHEENKGVGGAVISGYRYAIENGADVVVKVDGDGQMNPRLIPLLVEPILNGQADYTKGNRFFNVQEILQMPKVRIFGNLILSFFSKISTGYWQVFDPNNGFTAIDKSVLRKLPLDKISNRYFFETDMLFRLNLVRAVVVDVPMDAVYGNEKSSLSVMRALFEFPIKHFKNFVKRIVYSYYLRDITLASLELPVGMFLLIGGSISALYNWINSAHLNQATPTGTLILIAMMLLSSVQLLLSFSSYDMQSSPKKPISNSDKI